MAADEEVTDVRISKEQFEELHAIADRFTAELTRIVGDINRKACEESGATDFTSAVCFAFGVVGFLDDGTEGFALLSNLEPDRLPPFFEHLLDGCRNVRPEIRNCRHHLN